METAIAFAAGMLLTLIALALEDWTRRARGETWRLGRHSQDERKARTVCDKESLLVLPEIRERQV